MPVAMEDSFMLSSSSESDYSDSGSDFSGSSDGGGGSLMAKLAQKKKAVAKPKPKAKAAAKPRAKAQTAASKKKAVGQLDKFVVSQKVHDSDSDSYSFAGENSDNGGGSVPPSPHKGGAKRKALKAEDYKRLKHEEHVLARPEMYLGSVKKTTQTVWTHEFLPSAVPDSGDDSVDDVDDDEDFMDDGAAKKKKPAARKGAGAALDPKVVGRLVQRECTYVPGLVKLFDEIIVNAADNHQRDPTMNAIKVTFDTANGAITVWNNGETIPVEKHPEERTADGSRKLWTPELVFGHMMAGTNFDDEEERTWGGRNGLGAKLTNIWSTRFIVETTDHVRGKKFKQEWSKNMTRAGIPKVTSVKAKTSCTSVTFYPELERLHMKSLLEDDSLALMRRRVFDIAGTNPKLTVTMDGIKLKFGTFRKFADVFFKNDSEDRAAELTTFEDTGNEKKILRAFTSPDGRWEVVIGMNDTGKGLQQVSFVNGVNTLKGGTHINDLTKQIGAYITTAAKRRKVTKVDAGVVKKHLFLVVKSLINNPEFESQAKEELRSLKSEWKTQCKFDENTLKGLCNPGGLLERVIESASANALNALGRTGGGGNKARLTGLPKLDDANFAGTKRSKDCTLILTEGDSAKAFAVAGLSVVGRDYYGVFPLKGKPLNVRDAKHEKVLQNDELNNIKTILGLRHKTVYTEENIKQLRYGKLMIMTDQDPDGSHIKGLLLNFFHFYWESLLKVKGFLVQFVTPIVKATKKNKATQVFYTLPEFETWKEEALDDNGEKGWQIKYYKGLGTSTSAEAKEYFQALDDHKKFFKYAGSGTADATDLHMVFRGGKGAADERKDWLQTYVPGTFLNMTGPSVSIHDFVQKEFILFSREDCERSIPSLVDGFKPVQRKILFCSFKRKMKADVKVAQLAGYVGEHSAYHHGEVSLQGAIVNMAQNWIGSNNINLLVPSGQFGTRSAAGKDHASPRYIFTRLEEMTRLLFPEGDDHVLDYLDDDGMSIEPTWYCPVIPMSLVNGCEGIGTGYSCSVPNFNPFDLIDRIRVLIKSCQENNATDVTISHIKEEELSDEDAAMDDGKPAIWSPESVDVPLIHPWYRGFDGTIEPDSDPKQERRYIMRGKWEQLDENEIEITELPVGTTTTKVKEILDEMLTGQKMDKKGNKAAPKAAAKAAARKKGADADDANTVEKLVKDFQEYHTDAKVHFVITFLDGKLKKLLLGGEEKFEKRFKLQQTINTTNMTLFDQNGKIHLYKTPEEILKAWFPTRLQLYRHRKAYQVAQLEAEVNKLSNRAKFVQGVIDKKIVIANRSRAEIIEQLASQKFDRLDKDGNILDRLARSKRRNSGVVGTPDFDVDESSDEDLDEASPVKAGGYDYLLSMKLWSLSKEKVEKVLAEWRLRSKDLEELKDTGPEEMWLTDLSLLETKLASFYETLRLADENADGKKMPKKRGAPKRAPAKPKPASRKRVVSSSDEESMSLSLDDSDSSFDASPKKQPAKKAKNPSPVKRQKATVTKKSSTFESLLETSDSSDAEIVSITSKKAVAKKPAAKRAGTKAAAKRPAAKKAAAKRAPVKKQAPKKKSSFDFSESEDDSSSFAGSSDDDADMPSPPARAPRAGRTAARKPVVYNVDSDSDSFSESESSYDP